MLGLESNHMKVEAYVKIENTSNQGHFSFNGHSIICQSATYYSFCQIGSNIALSLLYWQSAFNFGMWRLSYLPIYNI